MSRNLFQVWSPAHSGKNLKDKLRKNSQVKVHLKQIPPEGLHLEGEEDCLIPELETEGFRCVGPMQYRIDIGVSEGSLWANGSLKQPIELTCVACLEKFVYDIKVPAFALHTELHGPETVNLSRRIRAVTAKADASAKPRRRQWRQRRKRNENPTGARWID